MSARAMLTRPPELRVVDDPAADCARSIAHRLQITVRRRGEATMAVSGGSTAPSLFEQLAGRPIPWRLVQVWQVDERVAPDGHPDRNASQLSLLPAEHHLMPVTSPDLAVAARVYARSLPACFDVVHLGMGDDGHTASWPPGDPVVDSREPVALSQPYQGRVRMTLTPRVVNAARGRVVLLQGAAKARALAAWLATDRPRGRDGVDLPIARLRRSGTVVFCDTAAARSVRSPRGTADTALG